LSTGIPTACAPQLSSNSASDHSSLPLIDGYPNSLRAAIVVECYPHGLRAEVLIEGYPNGLDAAILVDGYPNGLSAAVLVDMVCAPQYLSTSIPTVCAPQYLSIAITTVCPLQHLSNSASDGSMLPLVDGYPVGLRAGILVELLIGWLIASARRLQSQRLARRNTCRRLYHRFARCNRRRIANHFL
jgi:hypothetical protein